ncbi:MULTISPECIES: hydroxysqualene dehydroxylase HpnE [Acidobacteriaceae]|uniref:hydroxysqualene dehydroxylase HpnE n=1 Tax=Acidobacteriaceae TaxID=204434 RepID=UPI00131DBBBA|nr:MULTISPECIES: hydroxysqualene dehydroxylase HpnE [Acidobacteriaceae]MDW5266035.1 hydroxysqualene dehydroxylase HpnE [Edaphobacter sp.]
MSDSTRHDVIVAGAGVAGLAAAVALADAGAAVTLLERRPYIGGRAYSYEHLALEETIDSQHVVLGCCTNILDLCNQAGIAGTIRWYDELTFLEPGGRRSLLRPGILPAPAHQAISFLRAPMLTLRDKTAIAAGLARFLRGYPADDSESFASWLKRTGQTDRAIRHFWEPVVVGALNDTFERCSVKYAGKVFHESFLRSAPAGRLGIPTAPLSEFFSPIAELAQRKGVAVKLKSGIDRIQQTPDKRWQVEAGSEIYTASSVILATDFRQTKNMLADLSGSNSAPGGDFGKFMVAPITTVHLWYDRDVVGIDHAVLLDTRIQWMFAKSRIRRWPAERGSYLELVISASWPELEMGREEILSSAIREFELFFPAAKTAKLVKSGVLKEARATFSVTPGLDRFRPKQATQWPGLYLAGDWTATEWPATMEGAVRSGRLAAGALMGDSSRFMAPELPAQGLMRWLSRQ